MPENGLKVCPGTQTLDSCTLGSDEKIRRPSSSFLPARVTLTNSDLARRSLQPKSRDKIFLIFRKKGNFTRFKIMKQ